MGNQIKIESSVIGNAKVYQFEVGLVSGKFQVLVSCDIEKQMIVEICDKAKYAQNEIDYLLILKKELKIGIVSLVQDKNIWIGTSGSSLWLLRNNEVVQLLDKDEWGSGYLEDGDVMLCLWGEIEDLGVLNKDKQLLALVLARVRKGVLWGMMIKTFWEVKEETGGEMIDSNSLSVNQPIVAVDEVIEKNKVVIQKPKDKIPGWVLWLPDRSKVETWEARFHLESYRPKGRTLLKYLGLGCLMCWLILGTWGWWNVKGVEIKNNWDQQVAVLNGKIDEAINVGKSNNIRAEGLLADADAVLNQLAGTGMARDQIENLRTKIQSVRSSITGNFNTLPVTWFTLSLIREGLSVDELDYRNSEMWLLDKNGQRIVQLNVDSKSANVVWGQEHVGQSVSLAKGETLLWWVDLVKVFVANDKAVANLNWDTNMGQVVDSGSFGDFYYVMTTQGIVKCSLVDKIECSDWLRQEAKDKWISYRTMAIDTRIWVANETSIKKYASGVQENWTVNGLDGNWGEILKIVTDDKSKNLYVLDRGNKRVAIIDKETGNYIKSFTWGKMDSIIDVAVDETKSKMWWMARDVIYEVGL